MLQPKRSKFRKQFKGRIHGLAKGGSSINFGSYGLKATEPERITSRQIEAARRALTRHMKRQGRVWIRVFPDIPVTAKPIEKPELILPDVDTVEMSDIKWIIITINFV